jgi:hypothetical protein
MIQKRSYFSSMALLGLANPPSFKPSLSAVERKVPFVNSSSVDPTQPGELYLSAWEGYRIHTETPNTIHAYLDRPEEDVAIHAMISE